jgi:signal peptidase II
MRFFLLTILATCVVSIAAGMIAVHALISPVHVIGDFAMLKLSMNPGIAFSLSIPSPWQEILIIAALVVVTVIAVRSPLNTLTSLAFGMIIGGAVANLFDRFADGFVTDFLLIGTFPVFNIADSAITVGAVLLLVEAWLEHQRAHQPNIDK